ncbi:hypothetical protein [Natrinema versiforme]|uniref:Uncharacterized protein n=1 Tax=Natrinema versiforme TaxID=88724 RepID=A0A4P8WEK0_9EURY|nr:hypothetical protein [Natrinema versiforme]QCS41688.1 hypothetical protein FEJ81_04715 [Natrinema versiforme]
MIGPRVVSIIVVSIITATVLASGPLVPVELTTYESPCEGGSLSSEGNAVIQPSSIPESATLTRSEFGAEVWKLDVPDATVRATDVQGCVRVTYEISISELGITSLSAVTVSEESPEMLHVSMSETTLSPDRVSEEQYDAEVRLTYHGVENQTTVERTLIRRNITVEVAA